MEKLRPPFIIYICDNLESFIILWLIIKKLSVTLVVCLSKDICLFIFDFYHLFYVHISVILSVCICISPQQSVPFLLFILKFAFQVSMYTFLESVTGSKSESDDKKALACQAAEHQYAGNKLSDWLENISMKVITFLIG